MADDGDRRLTIDDDSLFSREYKYFLVGFSISCEKFWKFMAGPRYFGIGLELICTDYYIIYAERRRKGS